LTRPNRTHPRRGFTLTEILLVLLIIALSAAIVVPNLRRRGPGGSDAAAASELVSLLRHARTAARHTGRTHTVHLTNDEGGCTATLDGSRRGAADPLPVQTAAVTAFNGSASGAPGPWVVSFGATGPDRAYTIELAGDAGRTVRIEITGRSGLVRLTTAHSDETNARTAAIADYWETQCRHALP